MQIVTTHKNTDFDLRWLRGMNCNNFVSRSNPCTGSALTGKSKEEHQLPACPFTRISFNISSQDDILLETRL